MQRDKVAMIIEITKKPNHLSETEATIPNEIAKKYTANSKGDLTDYEILQLTMPQPYPMIVLCFQILLLL